MILNDAKTIRVGCNYKTENGKWTKFTRCVSKVNYSSSDDLSAAIGSVVNTVSRFYEENHCSPTKGHDEHSAEGSPAKEVSWLSELAARWS